MTTRLAKRAAGRGDPTNWAGFHSDPTRSGLDAFWFILVYSRIMAQTERPIRQSVSLPPAVARRVKALAKRKRTSANRVLVELIESGLETRENEKRTFYELADRLTRSSDETEVSRLKEMLARLTFGD